MRFLIPTLITLVTACYGEGQVGYRATYVASTPELVYVSPGVQVIADYDEPIFYADSVYWRYDGGVWYRSANYRGGWQVSYNVPVAVRRIDRPTAYVHFHGNARVARPMHARDHRHKR